MDDFGEHEVMTRSWREAGSGLSALSLPDGALLDHIEPIELPEALSTGTAIVIDVRSTTERRDGCLAGSLHIPAREWVTADEDCTRLLRSIQTGANARGSLAKHWIFHCMYSKERGPQCARAAAGMAGPGVHISVLRGGFQRCMAELWPSSKHLVTAHPQLFDSVHIERWVEHGRQGLVWRADLDPIGEMTAWLDPIGEMAPPFLPRVFPFAFRKLSGDALHAALPYVYEIYGPHAAAAAIPGAATRSREVGSVLHLRYHTIPHRGTARSQRHLALLAAAAVWLCLFPRGLQLRSFGCALVYSFMELAFTTLERGTGYTSLAQFGTILLYTPLLLDAYGALLGTMPVAYVLLFPLNVWLLEIVVGAAIIWVHGHNVAWCYADYADAFANGSARLGHAPAWLALGVACFWLYPWLIALTSGV
mgnify:CR=1 FL=1